MQEPFHIIVSTMRSGSSLFGHLLAEAGWIRYAGETHTRLDGEAGIEDAIRKIRNQGCRTHFDAPPCDKVLGHEHLPDEGEFIARRAERQKGSASPQLSVSCLKYQRLVLSNLYQLNEKQLC